MFFYKLSYKKSRAFPGVLHKTKAILKPTLFEVVTYPIRDRRRFLRSFKVIGAPLFEPVRDVANLIHACFRFRPELRILHEYRDDVTTAVRVPGDELKPLGVLSSEGFA